LPVPAPPTTLSREWYFRLFSVRSWSRVICSTRCSCSSAALSSDVWPTSCPRQQPDHGLERLLVERLTTGAVLLDGPSDDVGGRPELGLVQDRRPREVRGGEAVGHGGVRQRDEVRGPGVAGRGRRVLLQVPRQDLLAVLGLQHRAADVPLAPLRLLVPPVAVPRDVPALDLDRGQTDPRPGDQQVDLVLPLPLEQPDGVEEDSLVRQRVPQRLPHRALGAALVEEVGLGREAAGHSSL
jgi:hypothetical protein